jgi:hypothetical protein
LDKIMVCRHCGHERDVLDEVTIERDGVTIHRKDLGGDQAMAAMGDLDDLMPQLSSVVGADLAAQVREQLGQGQASGKLITHTSVTTTVHRGDEATKMMADMGVDLDAIVSQSLKQAREETQQPTPKPKSAGKSMRVAFVVILTLAAAGAATYYFL